jgi:signal transduction histidine kinase
MDLLRLLVLEDSEEDTQLITRELVGDDFDVRTTRAENAEQLVSAMNANRFDAVVVDYVMPRLTWQRSLALVRELDPWVPVIVVSGKRGEDYAVETIRGGCDDYVVKERLFRLAPALRRGIKQAAERRDAHAVREARAQLEEQLRRARKLEAVGLLAAHVGHDLNNTLTLVVGSIELALAEPALSASARERLGAALESLERAGASTRQLRSLDGAPATNVDAVDLNRLVATTARLVEARLPAGCALRFVEEAHFPRLRGDASSLGRALLNLVLNARDAIGENGEITLRIRREARVRGADSPAEPFAVIEVTDDGAGLSEEARERAFEPFFTTKADRGGAGLGLASAYQCARAHGGWVELAPQSPRGTRASLVLPVVETSATPAAEAGAPRGRGERVLLVDGNQATQLLEAASLEAAGFRVTTASNVAEAVAALASGAPFDAVVTDSLTPGGGAAEVLRRIQERGFHEPVFLLSSFRGERAATGFAAVISRPLEPAALVSAILATRTTPAEP